MNWQLNDVSGIYAFAVFLLLIIVFFSFKKNINLAGRYFSFLALATVFWALGYFLGMFSRDTAFKLLMLRLEYLGSLSAGYFWFLFVLAYTRREKWINPISLTILALIPAFSYVQILFIEQHTFFYRTFSFVEVDQMILFQKEYGPGFYIACTFNYLLTLSGLALIVSNLKQGSPLLLKQKVIIMAGALIMLLPNFFYVSGNNPFQPYDPTPIAFAVADILFIYAIIKYQFLSIVPIAQSVIYKNLKNGIIILDIRAMVISMNDAAGKILGIKPKSALGKHISVLFPDPNPVFPGFGLAPEIKTEIFLGADEACYEMHISTLYQKAAVPAGQIILLYDITQLKKALLSLDAFARTVAHDLKSPVATIANIASLLTDEQLNWEERKKLTGIVAGNAEKMTRIIDAFLLLAKTNRNEELTREIIDNRKLVDEALTRLDSLIKERGAVIRKPEKWIDVYGHAELIEEVWVNYISNAIKYSGEKPLVALSVEELGEQVKMCVTDHGKPLSEADQNKLFVSFARLDQHRDRVAGYGLGLSIVKNIVTKLGGEVGVESNSEKGNSFYFTLPRAFH
ncbi:MAG TPA: histidine kinase N-terminal 7TM domain-containing protein [Prolixibacteraceae bacterium]|nr:histidine kinase N-terminal 7TM domain-containing protein [Prolixibacteraceae bacterium]